LQATRQGQTTVGGAVDRGDVDSELVARYAPLVRVWRDDPPGDPDIWLEEADLVRYDESGTPAFVCPASDRNAWPDDAVTEVRPHETSAAGLALVPRVRAPKLVPPTARGASFGRQPVSSGEVQAPCLYEADADGETLLVTYWFFFPTSTSPANLFAQMLPAMADALHKRELSLDEFPPNSVNIPRRSIDRFWESVAARSPFVSRFVETGRKSGIFLTSGVVAAYQFLGLEAAALIAQLDPAAQERLHSLYVHEGDWEGVSVRVDQTGAVTEVVYWAHGHAIVDRSPVVENVDHVERIVAEIARASHACARPTPIETIAPRVRGAQGLLTEALPGANGAVWRTWDNLRPVRGAGWYGFGGAWGRARLPPVGSMDRRRLGGLDLWLQSTGPLGPGPTKRDRNREALALTRSLPETRGG
jgi:hypothetical protein